MAEYQGDERRKRKFFSLQFTLGNVLSICSTIIGAASVLYYIGSAYYEFKTDSQVRIARLEVLNQSVARLIENQQHQIDRIFDLVIPSDHAENDRGNP